MLTVVCTILAYVAMHGPEIVVAWSDAIVHARDAFRKPKDQ